MDFIELYVVTEIQIKWNLYLKCFNLFSKHKCPCKLWGWSFTGYPHRSYWLTLGSRPRHISFRAAIDRFLLNGKPRFSWKEGYEEVKNSMLLSLFLYYVSRATMLGRLLSGVSRVKPIEIRLYVSMSIRNK